MSPLPVAVDVLLALLLLLGAVFALIGSIGLLRFSDVLKRLHGPTKAGTVGVGAVLIVSLVYWAFAGQPGLHELLITLFVVVTAPVAAHMLVKAAVHRDPTLRPPPPGARDKMNS
jgi:multicomponent K+:H+ antiporter subunit G